MLRVQAMTNRLVAVWDWLLVALAALLAGAFYSAGRPVLIMSTIIAVSAIWLSVAAIRRSNSSAQKLVGIFALVASLAESALFGYLLLLVVAMPKG
jgi:hypothetical protein